jgi:hypothetical protein
VGQVVMLGVIDTVRVSPVTVSVSVSDVDLAGGPELMGGGRWRHGWVVRSGEVMRPSAITTGRTRTLGELWCCRLDG